MKCSDRSIPDTQPLSKRLRVATSTTTYHEQEDTTVEVNLHEVPDFLRCGEYYRSFKDDASEEPCTGDGKDPFSQMKGLVGKLQSFSVPSNCYKANTTITNSVDLHHLLSTLRFWVVDVLPDSVIAYALDGNTGPSFSAVAEPFIKELPKLRVLQTLCHPMHRNSRLVLAIKGSDCEEIVEYLFEHCKEDSPLDKCVADTAAEVGSLKYLQYAHEHGYRWSQSTCAKAARGGYLDCLVYAHECGCPWDESTTLSAVCGGHLDCLTYAHQHRLSLRYFSSCMDDNSGPCTCTLTAAYHGHLNCLQYAHENGVSLHPERHRDAAIAAAKGGHVDCLQYALSNGCSLNEVLFTAAASYGSKDVLMYLNREGCPWGTSVCTGAARKGYLDSLQYLHEQGCPWDERTTLAAAYEGRVSCLEYAITHGCPVQQDICTAMFVLWVYEPYTTGSRIHCLKYMHHLGYQVDEETTEAAESLHDILCVEYLASMENQVQPP